MAKKHKKSKDLSDLGGMVFSTDADFNFEEEEDSQEYVDPKKGKLIIRYETAHRGGKKVTIVERFTGTDEQMKELGKDLKRHCGTGGSVVDDEILVQGDHRDKIKKYLRSLGYQTNDI